MTQPITHGSHHIGLTVPRLEDSAAFFTDLLGWQVAGRDDAYPAIFVTDSKIMVTLWQAQTDNFTPFDKDNVIGLHHLALQVDSAQALDALYHQLKNAKNVSIEFAPELLRNGPAHHMMCYEPGGIRIEFIWPGIPTTN
ncbi:MAG: VOC family protein [Proteobacteria bacterium]|jgi:catechol 2,3-dioxygenase-like lactoylglutathione lyase family enzyme|nr:VOC family protein [Pseudomonadota bacterium]